MIVQLNHSSKQKPFKIGYGYNISNGQTIREWNKDCDHYRKFIQSQGFSLSSLTSQPQKDNLFFWGEWEGNSFFKPINNGNSIPNGIHEPFHSISIRGCQNTDPYVFGDFFKYSICLQTGVMLKLPKGSLILLGTNTKLGFLLDTVFVIKQHEPATSVFQNKAANYTSVYREETLEQLEGTYLGPNPSLKNKLYHGQNWWDDNNYFSFVPCVCNSDNFNKVVLTFPWLTKQKIGHPYKHLLDRNPIDIWKEIAEHVINNGFLLGVKFDEPTYNNLLLNRHNKPIIGI